MIYSFYFINKNISMISVICCVTSQRKAHGAAGFMPANCCKSGQGQDLLGSLWVSKCWKAPLAKLVLNFPGDIRLSSPL